MNAIPRVNVDRPLWRRFWTKVEVTPGCWLWVAGRFSDGYGQWWDGNRTTVAHRWLWQVLFGVLEPDMQLDHLCQTRPCVSPYHLEPVTPRENTLRSKVAHAARNARKQACKWGHQFTDANTYITPSGARRCRRCQRRREQGWRTGQGGGS